MLLLKHEPQTEQYNIEEENVNWKAVVLDDIKVL